MYKFDGGFQLQKFKDFKNDKLFIKASSITLHIREVDRTRYESYQKDNNLDQYNEYYVLSALLFPDEDMEITLIDPEAADEGDMIYNRNKIFNKSLSDVLQEQSYENSTFISQGIQSVIEKWKNKATDNKPYCMVMMKRDKDTLYLFTNFNPLCMITDKELYDKEIEKVSDGKINNVEIIGCFEKYIY